MDTARRIFLRLFDRRWGARDYLIARWLFLRAMGLIYFSAFYALLFQVKGLIGTDGLLPARAYLGEAHTMGLLRYWAVPSLLWISDNNAMLMALMWIGLLASVLLVANLWPRGMLAVCFLCYLSFVAAAQDFSGYQSDGMLLEAGFISLFLAPSGFWPGLGAATPAPWAAQLLLLYEWFRIYFESGAVKLLSGDPTWRNLTAMYEYYQNGPLPTWIGWYAQHLPHWFHIWTAAATLAMELALVWIAFLGRRGCIVCFWIVTVWQMGVILTANYTFLNYLVLVLAVLLLDDAYLRRYLPVPRGSLDSPEPIDLEQYASRDEPRSLLNTELKPVVIPPAGPAPGRPWTRPLRSISAAVTAVAMIWVAYATTVEMARMFWRDIPLPTAPVAALDPFRIANQYGLFAVMTPHRYEIEFQGSNDGKTWTPYPFRYKPQDVHERPRIYAPYQPRFDWNLWFASLGTWEQNAIVPSTEIALLRGDKDVLGLFGGNPFPSAPPTYLKVVLWQYWFSTWDEKRDQGIWWNRKLLGSYAPTLVRLSDGRFGVAEAPSLNGPPEPQ